MAESNLHTATIKNDHVRIDYLTKGALRLVGLYFGNQNHNLFVELPEIGWDTPYGYYRLIGGHRFWVAPESMDITYLPEPEEILQEIIPHGVRLIQPVDPRSQLQKILEVTLQPGQAKFSIKHILINHSSKVIRAAAWGISQFPLGGIGALPQPDTSVDVGGYLPNRSLVLWPYTRLNDPRLRWMEKHLMIRASVIQKPCKVGYHEAQGWGAYYRQGVLVRKQVVVQPDVQYPDMNSSIEMYIDHRFFELESLGPLVDLKQGEATVHEELWSLEKIDHIEDEEDLAHHLGA